VAAKSNGAKSTAAKSITAKSTTRSASANTRPAANKGPAAKSAAKPVAASYRAPQQQPTPDRYQEIQQALADRGYFGGPVDGNWGPTSVDALKRFQHDQSLLEDGKVGALSLIALGLGPKRQTAPDPATAPNARKGAEAPEAP
jgi:peptidoglycan hydrolase-like protein with peptidoglycan-binding domain